MSPVALKWPSLPNLTCVDSRGITEGVTHVSVMGAWSSAALAGLAPATSARVTVCGGPLLELKRSILSLPEAAHRRLQTNLFKGRIPLKVSRCSFYRKDCDIFQGKKLKHVPWAEYSLDASKSAQPNHALSIFFHHT